MPCPGKLLRSLCLFVLAASFAASPVSARPPSVVKDDAITLMQAYETTFFLSGKNRLAHDPYAFSYAGIDKLQTESTAMAMYYGGIDNLDLDPTELQEIYDFFAYMMDSDDWMFNDYTIAAGREYKKSLHVAWVLIALDMLIDRGISDVDNLLQRSVDALEAGTDVSGYMSGDPISNESIRTKYVQSLPFFFKVAQDLGDTGAIAAARRSIDFYMANCIDASYDLWKVDASGSKTTKLVSHEMGEFAHGLYLFHQYETDPVRRATLQTNLQGVLGRYTSSAWSHTNSFGEKYISNSGSSGNVNTLAQFQIQLVLALAARQGWVASSVAADYFPIIDRIRITGAGDPERDNNYYYQANPDTGTVISGNINSYLPGYVIYAMDLQYLEISGKILDGGASPIPGVTLSADNGGFTTATDASGDYVLSVPYDWTGTVTASAPGYTFAPPTRAHASLIVDVTGDDYTGTLVGGGSIDIEGTIIDEGALPVSDVLLTADAGGGTTTTDLNGDYTLTLPSGWSGTITPSRIDYTFVPTSRAYVSVTSNVAGDDYAATFTGTLPAYDPPHQIKADAIALLNEYHEGFFLSDKDRFGYDPYAFEFAGKDKLQTESTAMALFYGGVDNLGLDSTDLQEIYDFFAYMMDTDDWLYSDYTSSAGREYKKSLHTAWSLIALDIMEDQGITDSDDLMARTVDALEAAIDSNGYMAGDPISNSSIRTKFIQSLPFMFKVAQDKSDTGAIAKARLAVDFYMANCIDGSFDVWQIDAAGSKTSKLSSHEVGEFAHGLYLFHQYESDATRRATLQGNLTGILNRYASSAWTYTNSFGEKYMSSSGSAGTVNTLAQFQFQFVLALAGREGWVTPGLGLDYLPIIDRIQITGTGDGERDNNFYYLANPENGGVISSNINSYLPAYVIFAMDTQFVEIAGNVVDGGGLPISGVNLSADNGGGSATTDASGDYVLSVPYDWTGTVTASGTGLVFAPVSRSHTNLTVNISGDDYTGTPPPDLSPPDPDPMTFAIVPLATSSTSIWMTATTAVDQDSMPVAYAFECTNDASASSGWQSGAFYEASGLLPDTLYSFRVKARDSAAALNESSWSSTASATTPAPPAVCGNDVLETGEACDDGGTLDGDCCDASCQFEATDGPCDDADVCTTSDVCDGNGLCTPGTPLDCDDADVCTVDSCEPDLGCDYTPVQSPECSESHLVPSFSLPGHALLAALVLLAGGALLVRRPKELTR